MPGFAADRRSREPEWMDTEAVGYEDFQACLRDLATVNRWSLGARPTLAFLDRVAAAGLFDLGRPLAIVDVGSGYGDGLRAVADWARRRGLAVRLTGVDLNPWSTRAAREATADDPSIDWVTADVFDWAKAGQVPDIVLSALFTHHLDDDGVIRFLRWMEGTAGIGWFVNDLHRHTVSYHGFRAISTAARWHRFVRHDGPVSIARGFVRADWDKLLAAAGVSGARIESVVPFRLCVSRVRHAVP